jgi:hypothetical protein
MAIVSRVHGPLTMGEEAPADRMGWQLAAARVRGHALRLLQSARGWLARLRMRRPRATGP